MACDDRCEYSPSPPSRCRCSCGGMGHGRWASRAEKEAWKDPAYREKRAKLKGVVKRLELEIEEGQMKFDMASSV